MRVKLKKRRNKQENKKSLFSGLFCALMLLISFQIYAKSPQSQSLLQQEKIIVTGTITDAMSETPLTGVTILVEGTSTGTVTNLEGQYAIEVDPNAVLKISYVGYLTESVNVNNRSKINFSLLDDIESLDEVIVVGYGTQKKSDLTGSISSVSSEELSEGVGASFSELLTGKASGVSVVSAGGEPGGGVSINIRGAASVNASVSPLYVIDGYPMDAGGVATGGGSGFNSSQTDRNPLAGINPSDIESIEILKDASATAIYGARGANGVILITTKKGEEGKCSVTYDGYFGVQEVSKKLDLLSADEYYTELYSLIEAGAGSSSDTDVLDEYDGNGTDWQDLIFDKGPIQSHNLSIRGGSKKVKYFSSLNYFNQDGVVIESGYKRYGAKTNLIMTPNDKFEAGVNLTANYEYNNFVSNGFGINGESGTVYSAIFYMPIFPVYDEDGEYNVQDLDMDHPLANAYGKTAYSNTYRTFGNAYLEYEFIPGLKAKVSVGGDNHNGRKDIYIDRTTKKGSAVDGIATVRNATKANYITEGTVSYSKEVDNHSVNAIVGATYQKFYQYSSFQEASGFPSDATLTNNLSLGADSLYEMDSYKACNTLLSYLGRVNYSYNNKYLLTTSLRVDGSSKFGDNNKYGVFPSFSVGWKLNKEDFMQSLPAISTAKIRIGWGETGNQGIDSYTSKTTYSDGTSAILDGNVMTSTAPTRLANPDLKWETTIQSNIGIDYGFYANRIYGSFDYYIKKTKDMILDRSVPASTGYTTKTENIGSAQSSGWEFAINSHNLKGDLEWNTSLIISGMSSKVLDLGGDTIVTGSAGQSTSIFILEEGEELYSFYGYEVDGIWQTDDDFTVTDENVEAGDIKFKDQNGDGEITSEDKTLLGNSIPDFQFTLKNTFDYKNFELSIVVEASHGGQMLDENLVDTYYPVEFLRNKYAEPVLNRWTEDNPSNEYPSLVNSYGNTQVNSLTVKDASYIKLKTLTLRYNFNPEKLKFVKGLSVYASAENIHTFTKYLGFDPSINPNGNQYRRIDFSAYPSARTIIGGISVNF